MAEAMVTGRMSDQKKAAGNRILARENLKPSQAINLLYDRLIEDKNANFLRKHETVSLDPVRVKEARAFLDTLVAPVPGGSMFDGMTKAEIKVHRLRSKGLM